MTSASKIGIVSLSASLLASGLYLLTAQAQQRPLVLPIRSPRILVQKHTRKLMLYSGKSLVRTYSVGLGFEPVGDKVREGDGRTPEGDFRITAKNARSQFGLSLAINYPNAEDARRGLRDGLITRQQYNAIIRAIRDHRTPPQNTPLGGKILIHAGGCSRDWTWGCVALDIAPMRELFVAVPVGTPVHIEH